jgi:50S ribosomal protein L16 3-hydroxylase
MELAQEDGVEARLVLEKGKTPWELRKGPFGAKDFKALPASHWTLLVQAVDHYLPALSDYVAKFDFLPAWRIDDVMISYAVEGGSVGPHYDQYDVFLIQGFGNRRWQLGQRCDERSPRVEGTPLRILRDIDVNFDEVVNPGDLLYLPPGMAHFGVAQNPCTTYSIGFRAPALAHLLERVVDAALEESGSNRLFADSDRAPAPHPGELTDTDLEALRSQLLTLLDNRDTLRAALAPFLSEPKYDDYEPQGEELALDEIREALAGGAFLRRDPASRMIYTVKDGVLHELFINGQKEWFPPAAATLVRLLADQRRVAADQLGAWLDNADAVHWLADQMASGHWFLDSDD